MLKTFGMQEKNELDLNKSSKNLWIQLVDPTQSELESIKKDFNIPSPILNMHQAGNSKATIIRHPNLFAFTMELPIHNEVAAKIPFDVIKCTIVVVDNVVISISEKDYPIFTLLQKEYANLFADSGVTGLVYRFFELTTQSFIKSFVDITDAVDGIERKLQVSIKNTQMFDLLNHNKCYLYFIKSLKFNGVILKELSDKRLFASDHKMDVQMQDIMIANQQTFKKAEIYNSNLTNLMDAYSAAIENNLSLAVQYLTVLVTIVALPLGMAGVYGMNSPLPIQDEPYALSLLMGITGVIAVIFLVFFKIRRFI